MEYPSELLNLTHCVEYSPNCHKKFMLRLVGRGQGALDKKFKSETKDILGYGNTIQEAFEAAKAAYDKQPKPWGEFK